MHHIRDITRLCLSVTLLAVCSWRTWDAIASLEDGLEAGLLALPLTVIFPALLAVVLLIQGPTRTREGLLMRFGTIVHLLLIILVPRFALHLALGFPFVFLCVELFETRLPERLRRPLSKIVLP